MMRPSLVVVQPRVSPVQTSSVPVSSSGVVTVTQLPSPVNLSLYEGDDFSMTLTLTDPVSGAPISLVGATAKAQLRPAPGDPTITASFTSQISSNVITLSLLGSATQNLSRQYAWDCQITNASGAVQTLVAGSVSFTVDVTR